MSSPTHTKRRRPSVQSQARTEAGLNVEGTLLGSSSAAGLATDIAFSPHSPLGAKYLPPVDAAGQETQGSSRSRHRGGRRMEIGPSAGGAAGIANYSAIPSSSNQHAEVTSTSPASTLSETSSEDALPAKATGNPKFSYPQLAILLYARIVEPISFTILFPFVNTMIEHLLPDASKSSVGKYSGFLESLFSVCAFFCMYRWGKLSDRIGRKPVVVTGLLGVTAGMLMFGLSTTYWMAVVARAISGALCGNASVLRAALGEISSPETEGWLFPIWSVCWDLSVIVGPAAGALLADPHGQYPNLAIFDHAFFKTFPFFLPCGVVAALSFSAAIVVLLGFKETRDFRPSQGETRPLLTDCTKDTQSDEDEEVSLSAMDLMRIPAVQHMLVSLFFIAFIALAFDAVLVLFCYSSVPLGGLALTPRSIATCLSLRGSISIAFAILIFPALQRKYGLRPLYRLFAAAWIPCFILPPIMNAAAKAHPDWVGDGKLHTMWIYMAPLMILYACGDLAFPLNMIACNAAAPNRNCLGALNGIALSVGSLARSVSPAFVGYAYSVSAETHFPWVWIIFVGICVVAAIQAWWIKGRAEKLEEST